MVGFVDLQSVKTTHMVVGGGCRSCWPSPENHQTNYSVIVAQWMTGNFMENWKLCGDGKTVSPLCD